MEFTYIKDGIDAIVIDKFYTESQLSEIMTELKWLTKPSIMVDQSSLVSGEVNGVIQTSKRGVFLESVFKNFRHSAIISHCIDNTSSDEFKNKVLEHNTLYNSLFYCNVRDHLISYYENSDYYNPHTDSSFFTILSYFYNEPKQFDGGEIVLHSCNSNKQAKIEVEHNRVIIIPSCTVHEVYPIKSEMNNSLSGNGRYCVATFLTRRDERELMMKAKHDSN